MSIFIGLHLCDRGVPKFDHQGGPIICKAGLIRGVPNFPKQGYHGWVPWNCLIWHCKMLLWDVSQANIPPGRLFAVDFLILNQVFSQLSKSLLQVLFTKRWGNLGGELVQLELSLVDSKTTSSCFNELFEISASPSLKNNKHFFASWNKQFQTRVWISTVYYAKVRRMAKFISSCT